MITTFQKALKEYKPALRHAPCAMHYALCALRPLEAAMEIECVGKKIADDQVLIDRSLIEQAKIGVVSSN